MQEIKEVEVPQTCANDNDYHLLIENAERERIRTDINDLGLSNVIFDLDMQQN